MESEMLKLTAATLMAIYHGEMDAQLDKLGEAIKARREMLKFAMVQSLHPGDIVRFNDKTRPNYLRGHMSTVRHVMQTYVEVDLDQPVTGPNGKTWFKRIRVPGSLLEIVRSGTSGLTETPAPPHS